MLYRVVVDGLDILDYNDPTKNLLSPQLNMEIDTAGSLEFTIPPNHIYYDMFTAESIMPMTVEVYEDSVMHWFGRPIEIHLDFYKNKKLYCEGGLSFFSDSIIREEEYDGELLSVIFAAVISEHNSMVPSNRQFTVGNFDVADETVYRKFDYEQTSDALKNKFLDAVEGHFFVRRESGVNYIDFLKDMPYTCNQPVEFAENLLNFTYSFDGKDFATCVIPRGGNDEETQKAVDIKSVNGGSDILIGSTAAIYGNIVKVQQYSDIKDPAELLSEGRKYLTNLQYNAYLIECSAVDLHSKDGEKQQFRIGQKVNCYSTPHSINLNLPISKMTIYLDSAAKQITLGRIPKKTLSRFYKENVSGGGGGDADDDITDDGWALVPPDEDGGEPTMKKVPVRIQITELPYITTYKDPEDTYRGFDPTGLEVKLLASGLPNLTYFTDDRYIDSVVPMNELSFTYQDNGAQIPLTSSTVIVDIPKAKIMVWVWWTCPYNGRKHGQAFYITNQRQADLDAANGPHHIEIVTPPAKLEYYTGGFITLAGAKVVAYTEAGDPYNADGYEDGVIPHSELVLVPQRASIDKAMAMGEIDNNLISPFPSNYNYAILTSVSGKMPYKYDRKYYINTKSWVYSTPVYCTNILDGPVEFHENGATYQEGWETVGNAGALIAASFEPFTIEYTETNGNTGTVSRSTITATRHTGYINGQLKYYYMHATTGGISVTEPILNHYDTYQGMSSGELESIAIQMLSEGDISVSDMKQTIKVQWTPKETTLETSFDIKVVQGEHQR